jgi:hypothetical protein
MTGTVLAAITTAGSGIADTSATAGIKGTPAASSSSSGSAVAIVVVGGILALLLLGFLIYKCTRKEKKKRIMTDSPRKTNSANDYGREESQSSSGKNKDKVVEGWLTAPHEKSFFGKCWRKQNNDVV